MSKLTQVADGWGMDEEFVWHYIDGATLKSKCPQQVQMIPFRYNDPPIPRHAVSEQHSVANGGAHCFECVSEYVKETGRFDFLHCHEEAVALARKALQPQFLPKDPAVLKPAPKSDRYRLGWASIETPGPPYHYWDSNGAKICTHEGEWRPRFFYPNSGYPTQAEACPRCWASQFRPVAPEQLAPAPTSVPKTRTSTRLASAGQLSLF